jgi:hypothetical protein
MERIFFPLSEPVGRVWKKQRNGPLMFSAKALGWPFFLLLFLWPAKKKKDEKNSAGMETYPMNTSLNPPLPSFTKEGSQDSS